MDLAAIRGGIVGRLNTISGLNVFRQPPVVLAPPCAWPMLEAPLDYEAAFGGEADVTFGIHIAVVLADAQSNADQLDGYLSTGTATSIPDAILGDKTLGGTVEDCDVAEITSYGVMIGDDGATRYLVATLKLGCLAH